MSIRKGAALKDGPVVIMVLTVPFSLGQSQSENNTSTPTISD
jgi:hypothetical protein